MGNWVTDRWDDFTDSVEEFTDAVIHGDFSKAFEMTAKGMLGAVTLGLSNRKFMPDTPNVGVAAQDRKITHRSTVAPHEIVYGEVRKGGNVVYIASTGANDRYMHLVVVLAAHKISQIENIYFNDTLVAVGIPTFSQFQSFTIELDYSQKLFCYACLGGQSWVPPEILDETPIGWTSEHILEGHAYLYMKLTYDRDLYRSGIPNVNVTTKGKIDIYDPRTVTYINSDNHALCVLDYILSDYGLNAPSSEVDMQSIIDGANYCDEMVGTPLQHWSGLTEEKRFTVAAVLRVEGKPIDNLEQLVMAGGAILTFFQGKWRYISAKYTAPVLSLNEDDLISGVSFSPSAGRDSRINIAKGQYINPQEEWELTDYPQVRVDSYIANDLEELETTVDQPFITSPYRAQRLAKIAMERSRYGQTVKVTAKLKALQLTVGDRVSLTVTKLGWTPKVFLVLNIELDLNYGVTLTLKEDHSDIYDWNVNEQTTVTAPPTVNLPDMSPVAPTDLTIGEELYTTTTIANIKARALISWTGVDVPKQWYDSQYRVNGDTEWLWIDSYSEGEDVHIDDIKPETYDFRVRSQNGIGKYSAWAEITAQVFGKTAPPDDVESLFLDGDILNWTYPNPPLDLAGFEIRIHHGNRQTWADATPLHVGIVTASKFNVLGSTTGEKTFLVKAIDTSGNYSANPAIVVLGLGDPVVDNVILTYDYKANTWPGTITDGSINGSNEIEADQVGVFYNSDPNSIFYDQNAANDFYQSTYLKVVYAFEYTVAAQDAGSQLTIDATIVGDSFQIDYIPPSGGATYAPFPGYIPKAEAGLYKFKIYIPSQFGAVAPKITALSLNLDVEDITENFENIAIASGGTRLPITKTYRGIKNVTLTMQTDASGVSALKVTDKNHTLGPLIYAYDTGGTAVATNIDAFVRGY